MTSSSTSSAEQTTAEGEKKDVSAKTPEKKEIPFSVDALLNCTTRMTHKAWYLFYNNRKNIDFIRKTPLRASLTLHTVDGAIEIQQKLTENNISSISRQDKTLHFTATFEMIQSVIKDSQVLMLDAIELG